MSFVILFKIDERTCKYRITSINSHAPKMCYPKREGYVMPILFWDNTFLGAGIDRARF